ncbi:hypothetical protein [Crassaminicella profunda]|uniref:hypothetical protein n=1 Tax=Crassaminicella profunda TaxID=1286698 RepID=UPI001CA71545|nr:hypothetical protein [Crassaminicella profunda]QZY54919.1 hypothetical protein K7H06_18155 [Crassaminicella profunda]
MPPSFYNAMIVLFCGLCMFVLLILILMYKKGHKKIIEDTTKQFEEIVGKSKIVSEEDKTIKKEILECLERINDKLSK